MRPTPRLAAAAVPALAIVLCGILGGILTGCAQSVALRPADDATNAACADVITRLPETVAGLGARETNAQGTAAWGSPASVILRCGVAVPDPTASLACVTVDEVDWLRDPAKDPSFVFTTYGRDPAVEVIVDSTAVSGASALTDLSGAIGIIPAVRRCVSPEDVLQGGEPVG